MIKRILIALSGTPFTKSAITHAFELAKSHNAEVTGVTVSDPERLVIVGPIPVGGGAAAHDLAEYRKDEAADHVKASIEMFKSAGSDSGVAYHLVEEHGNVFEQFLSLWRYHDCTVIGLRGLFEYGVIHNPNDQVLELIAHGLRPIVAVAREHRTVKRVYIAYSGSMESAKAMKRFTQMHLWNHPVVRIGHFGKENAEVTSLLADAAEYVSSHGFKVDMEHVDGSPHENLLDRAEAWDADMIVLGATSRNKLSRLIWGDTALDALLHSDIPLFISQ